MINNKNKPWYEMDDLVERNREKLRAFNQSYGKSAILKADYAELEAKCAETAEFTVEPHENVQIDSEASTSGSLQNYIDLMNKHRKLDPNRAFRERKAEKNEFKFTVDEIIDSLTT